MTNTFVIDANRKISKATDTNKLQWINNIEGGLQLLRGDKISMASAQINQRGANINSINLEEDINEVVYFVYYIIDAGTVFAGVKGKHYMYRDGTARPTGFTTNLIGWTHTPYYYWGNDCNDLKLKRGKVNIQIQAGSYSPNNIATIISEAFAGQFISGKNPFDYAKDDDLRQNVNWPGLCATSEGAMILIDCNAHDPQDKDLDSNVFCQIYNTNTYIDDIINDGLTITKEDVIADGNHWITTQSWSNNTDHDWYPINIQQFLGAVPMLNWDADKSRFTISNLHAPYRIMNYPDVTKDDESADRGQEATRFFHRAIRYGVYPQNAIGGIAITNPAWQHCLNESSIAQDLLDKETNGNQAEKNTASCKITTFKFHQYWDTDIEAKAQWQKTIWGRLGFQMEQFTDDNTWLDFYPIRDLAYDDGKYELQPGVTSPSKMIGLTTTQEITTDMSLSSGGLGSDHHGEDGKGIKNQGFSYEVPGYIVDSDMNEGGDVTPPEHYEMLTEGLPLVARYLPKLSDAPYYNIWTSILDSANWFTNRGHNDTLIGQCNKNYQSADFFYQFNQGISFVVSQDKVISEIKTMVLNPDGSSPNPDLFDENCCVLYHIERPFREPIEEKKK